MKSCLAILIVYSVFYSGVNSYNVNPTPENNYPVNKYSSDLTSACLFPRGQFTSPNSCKHFVNCWDGTAIEQECPTSTLWNDVYGFCDFAARVNCGTRPLPVNVPATSCTTSYATYRNPQNCSEFFVCDYFVPVKFACPDNLYYNTELGVCDYPYNVQCNAPPQYFKSSADVVNELEKFASRKVVLGVVDTSVPCKLHSVQKLSGDCTKVAVCHSNGYTKVVNCPLGMAFDIESGKCLAENIAKC